MKNKKSKKAMLESLDVMIQQADKGPSGFWTDDYEGCGNPKIFPEFEDGLKHGRLVQKEHYLCPWNTAVLYGEGHGNIQTGCYYSCSINKAKYLPPKMLINVLSRLKKRLISGEYDSVEGLVPLLTLDEMRYIERQIQKAEKAKAEKHEAECKMRLKKAAALIQKYPKEKELFATCYGEKVVVRTSNGVIDFNPEGYKEVIGAEKFTYDEYIDVQIKSFHKTRNWFATCYDNMPLSFTGCIERKTEKNICFERILVDGMYSDGTCFVGKEDHVWMHISGFEEYQIGDCVSFYAEVYRYIKTNNGKQIDFALRNPKGIEQIEAYELPTKEDLLRQAIDEIICETCYLNEQCNRVFCLLPKGEKKKRQKQMFDFINN